ncbi:MAG: LLM class flavin-dependent oxidoreductase [Chloroflexi bacterium]|nr:LLM class flavin-dependent oxidoreductase [Chloroflexota bacterium]MDA1002355.1 LLM class flavin-dependent oxidoreductase [Chloroflexota bacterium]
MQFGLLYDFRNPPPWFVPSPALYAETFDQIRAIESFGGWDSVWVTEHHFTDDGYLPTVNAAASAIAMITERVKIGHSVLLLPLHHPLRIAEEGAIVDILSNGRFIFGPGLGYKLDEFDAFGINRKHRPRVMDESMEIITRAWTEERFSFHGRHFNFDDLAVTPRPVQQPRPPIWMAARADAPLKRAARFADGVIAVGSPELITRYRGFVADAGRDPAAMTVAVLRSVILSEDPGAAWEDVKEHVRWRSERYGQWYGEAGDLPEDRDWTRRMRMSTDEPGAMANLIKDVPTEIAQLEALERAGVDCVIYFATFPGYPPSKMLPTWERFAQEVIPRFRS